jgi:hypothetical protein
VRSAIEMTIMLVNFMVYGTDMALECNSLQMV